MPHPQQEFKPDKILFFILDGEKWLSYYESHMKPSFTINRIAVLIIGSGLIALLITAQLIFLQIVRHDYYAALAQKEHSGYTELPARRGEILTKDYHSGESYKLATNITLDLLYADPTLVEHKKEIATAIAPLIFDIEEEKKRDQKRMEQEWAAATTEEARNQIKPKTDEELLLAFETRLEELLSQEIKDTILLDNNLQPEIAKLIQNLNIIGIQVENKKLIGHPKEITDKGKTAETLSSILNIAKKELERVLSGKNRYVVLKRKLDPEISGKIQDLLSNDVNRLYKGIGLQENYYRFYPENTLSSQTLGFVDQNGNGQYGVEGTFDSILRGKEGIFSSKKDADGQQITVGESIIRPAVDGSNIILTIDRSIQLEVERKLEQAVKNYKADSGNVIIMDPKTGRIIAMASYPNFNPNEFSSAFEKKEVELSEDEIKNLVPVNATENDPTQFWLYLNAQTNQRVQIFKEKKENGTFVHAMYKNRVGPKVYRNSLISDLYEPGSVFKVITMSSAINAGEVKPNTTYNEDGPIKVDEYEIHNSTDQYRGRQTMTQVLENSSNIGISFVAKKLGRNLFYNYMKSYGFGERTDIELDGEEPGEIEFFTQWADSELLTHGFGQGILVTPLQMVSAISAIANEGLLMQAYIVDSIQNESGKITGKEPKIIRRVLTKENANTVASMMVSAVENGVARRAQVKGHYVAGKTGTSQTYKHGKALKGAGTTIASFGGFAPIENPQFVVLIKFDHPLSSPWGDSTAAPLFSEIAEYLFNYYNIPPDKE